MIILTWIAFLSLLIILHKFAWKPILAGLQAREDLIRKSVENAERAQEELTKIEQTRQKILAEAETKAKDVIEQSRQAAVEAAKSVEAKTRQEAQIMLENAHRQIKEDLERAQASLREESARVAVELAEKLIEQNIDEAKNRKIIDEFIKRI